MLITLRQPGRAFADARLVRQIQRQAAAGAADLFPERLTAACRIRLRQIRDDDFHPFAGKSPRDAEAYPFPVAGAGDQGHLSFKIRIHMLLLFDKAWGMSAAPQPSNTSDICGNATSTNSASSMASR